MRFLKFAPGDGPDRAQFAKVLAQTLPPESLSKQGALNASELEVLRRRIEDDAGSFSEPPALLRYIRSQEELLLSQQAKLVEAQVPAPTSTPDGVEVIVDDIVPRAKASEGSALSPAHLKSFTKLGLDDGQMARAAKVGLDPKTLKEMLTKPPPEVFRGGAPAGPENTAELVLQALEAGLPVRSMLKYHRAYVPVAQQLEAYQAKFKPDDLKSYILAGASVSDAIVLSGANYSAYVVNDLKQQQLPARLYVAMKKHAHFGHFSDSYGWHLRSGYNRLRSNDAWCTSENLGKLFDAGVLNPRHVDRFYAEIATYLDLNISFEDVLRVGHAGGSAEGLRSALESKLTLDDYLRLAEAKVPEAAVQFYPYFKGVDEMVEIFSRDITQS
ncbi:MAG: hypothetical protein IPJ65_12580 [Archangiaceae bacterium]|nr:hypothetical protein [Archangiaceae bacterium]